MSAPLPTLRRKRARRKKGRKRQLRLFKRTGKKGHRKEAAKHGRAMRKLTALIAKARARLVIDWSGHPRLTYRKIRKAARVALTVDGLFITSTTDGTHSPTSWHYKDRAFDAGSWSASEVPEKRAQEKLLKEFGAGYFAELFGPAPFYVKNGVRYSGVFPGHSDHLHVAVV